MRESTVISITNSKGGVGKTTTALNLGAALAAAKKRVLLIDNDPQGNLTAALGYTPGEQKNTLAKLVLVQIDSPEDLDLHLPRTVIHTETGIDLIPANKRLADAAARLQVMQLSQYNAAGFSDTLCEKIMDKLLGSLREQYDYIIIDCGLKHELLTINALAAADYCIIPVQAHFLASEGIPDVLEMVKNVQNRFNPNYRDFFAAFHIANVVYGLCNGINLAALSPDAQEVFLLQLETLDNSILFDAISILRQYFGLSIYDISAQDTTDLSDTCAQIALPAILIRLLDAVIRRGELSKNEYSQLCQLRSTLCERFVLSFKALDESDPLQTKYCLFFSLALSMLARDYRTGVAGTRDLVKCVGYAQQCINGEKKLNIPKADGYLQVALCLNARMEDLLNVTDTKMNGTLPFSSQLADAVREAVRDYHEGSMYKRDEAVRTFRRNLFPRWKPSLGNVLACCDIFQIILEAAYEKYVSAANQNNQNYQEIARLGYVSKAYLVLAAIGTSGGALNLLAQMLINQANQYEADQRIPFFRSHPDIGAFVQQHAASYGWPLNDNYALAYRVLQSVCGIQRGSQPYSHMKKAELVLKGYVSESSSTQLTSLNIAINGGLAMGHYWKGRLLLEQAKQDHDRCNDYENAAIVSFCATNVIERFDHLPENTDEDAVPQLVPPQWLSAIELLRYPDRVDFRVDRRMVFQAIHQNLAQQVEEVQSDSIQIHNERYRLTKKDVRSNLERCLDMVKAQFPDKVPLIQEMIRSIK